MLTLFPLLPWLYQIFLQQRWLYSGSAENRSSIPATRVSHVQVPKGQGMKSIFIEGKRKLGGLSKQVSMAFQWLSPCQEGRRVFLLPAALCYCCNLNYQSYQRLSTGDQTGLLQSTVGGDGFPLSDRTLFRASAILSEDPHSSFGKCYHHMFPLFVRGQYWEHMWLVQVLITRKLWSRL